jgi:hypothetical protein
MFARELAKRAKAKGNSAEESELQITQKIGDSSKCGEVEQSTDAKGHGMLFINRKEERRRNRKAAGLKDAAPCIGAT